MSYNTPSPTDTDQDRKVIQARELLAEASEMFREAALESLKEAKEICTIKGLIKPSEGKDDDET